MKHNVVRRTLAGLTAALLGLSAAATATAPAFAAVDDRLVAHYALDETTGTVAVDASGNGRDGDVQGGATLDRRSGPAPRRRRRPREAAGQPPGRAHRRSRSRADVLIEPAQATPYFIYGLGNTDSAGVGNGYLFATGNTTGPRSPPATGRPSRPPASRRATSPAACGRRITYTLDDAATTGTLYEDGVQVAQNTDVTSRRRDRRRRHHRQLPGPLRLRRRQHLKGNVRDFRIYDRALTAGRGRALSPHRRRPAGRATPRPSTSATFRGHRRTSRCPPPALRLGDLLGVQRTRQSSPPPARSPGRPRRRPTPTSPSPPRSRSGGAQPTPRPSTPPSWPTPTTSERRRGGRRADHRPTPTTCAATSRCPTTGPHGATSPGRRPTPTSSPPTASSTARRTASGDTPGHPDRHRHRRRRDRHARHRR